MREPTPGPKPVAPAVGWNSPGPCVSGRKFKKLRDFKNREEPAESGVVALS